MIKIIALSLFSSSGIGDLGLSANNVETVVANELLEDRANLFLSNNPNCKMFNGNIWELQNQIIKYTKENYPNLDIILATPPCQGMSSNGMGKMLSDYRKGIKSKYDERNRLILPTLHIIKNIKPKWIIFENVPNMNNTYIYDENGNLVNIVEHIFNELGNEYVGKATVVNVADYGVPQKRQRLITILTRTKKGVEYFKKHGTFLPNPTHSQNGDKGRKKWLTLYDAIGNVPKIDAKKGKNIDKSVNVLHKVPLLDEKKYFWVSNTPEGASAFNNQCINPKCMYTGNKLHGASVDQDGVNKSNSETPLYCEKCGELLPRPYVEDKEGNKRIMKGYVSAYKRMNWNEPASTLTTNFQYASSDNKIHPTQNRVLSMYEATIIQGINNYNYSFEINGKLVSDSLIRETIGESVPPKIIDMIVKNIIEIEKDADT